jgi:cell wall-associated NlpC family hydrolase
MGAQASTWGYPLHQGMHGPRVKDAQYLLKGHNHFRLHTYDGRITGYYGKGTARGAKRAKYYLGYPSRSLNGSFGAQLYSYLRGHKLPNKYLHRRYTRLTLHVGARGQRVKDAQWLMQGHNHFKLRTYSGRINGRYTQATATAAWWAKYWLGYPRSLQNGSFGPPLKAFLRGKAALPPAYKLRRRARVRAPAIHTLSGFAAFARTTVGTAYRWGGTDPFHGGADCSGLVKFLYSRYWGIQLPRTSQSQFYGGRWYSRPSQVGDLIFYYGNPPGHVTMYIGGGKMIQDPHSGARVYISYVRPGYVGVRRYLPSFLPGSPQTSGGGGTSIPLWLGLMGITIGILCTFAATRTLVRRAFRKAVHEAGDVADWIEDQLEDPPK